MGDYNAGLLSDPCYRMSTGDGTKWRSVELGDGTGYVRADALERASKFAADISGTCPYDMFDLYEPWEESCYQKCSADIDRAECWRRYFMMGDDSR